MSADAPDRRSTAGRAPPYLPFMQGAPDFSPNLNPIPKQGWLSPDTEAAAWLADKRQLMRRMPQLVRGGDLDGVAAQELLDMVQAVSSVPLENGWDSALEQAASLVSDDLCLLEAKHTGDWRLIAGVVCAPTYWTLPERIGLDLGGLHGPVPGGDPQLAGRIGRVFTGFRPGVVLERFNWTVQANGERSAPTRPKVAGQTVADLHLRVERQTIRKLPQTGAIIFTIRTCMDPLLPILRDGATREAFEDAWLGAPKRVRSYKVWSDLEDLVAEACRICQTGTVR